MDQPDNNKNNPLSQSHNPKIKKGEIINNQPNEIDLLKKEIADLKAKHQQDQKDISDLKLFFQSEFKKLQDQIKSLSNEINII